MLKRSLIILTLLSSYALATETVEKTFTQADITQLKQQWQNEQSEKQQKRLAERELFLQLETLAQTAIKQGKVPMSLFPLLVELLNSDYPLKEELHWLIINLHYQQDPNDPQKQQSYTNDLIHFALEYPQSAKRKPEIEQFLQRQGIKAATSLEMVCQQLQNNNLASEAPTSEQLLQFDEAWQRFNDETTSCEKYAQAWSASELKTAEKFKTKAVKQFTQNNRKGLVVLAENADPLLTEWLRSLTQLQVDPKILQNFVENQVLDEWNKAIVIHTFPAFIKTQSETIGQAEWETYQQWAEKFQLSADEIKSWKIAFLNRAFDNENAAFQAWRDAQLITLNADNLIERRLRLAILQKDDLKKWLAQLSNDAQNKAEWRYWLAKSDPTQREKLLTTLSQERGFYPMLAALSLGKTYQVALPESKAVNATELSKYQASLERIRELRELGRMNSARTAWVDLLQAVHFDEKIALSRYALSQHWYDLTVEGTIQAKAWDEIPLRLPKAYLTFFETSLQNNAISLPFAMAIARQESAFNPQARSHANAVGLMQMLPTTAKQTAENNQLPFAGENDLLSPLHNILLGTTHLNELNQKYPNNRILIAAAYNAGASRVEKWLARANGKLAMDEFIATIPFLETRGYVQNVLAYDYYYQLLLNVENKVMFTPDEQKIY